MRTVRFPLSMVKTTVLGARGQVGDVEAFIDALRQLNGGEGLALDADMICGKDHLVSAAMHATRAFERGDNVSGSVVLETQLYASGERQISKAMKKMGIKLGMERIALVFFNVEDPNAALERLGLVRDDDVLDASVEKAIRFGISPDELKAVPEDMVEDLVLERVAFVRMNK
jgi:KEOPS complex subunit Cgi121